MAGETIWSFGYGSNMDVEALETKKKVKVIDHTAAILKGWRLAFNLKGLELVEPAFANVARGDPTDEVHGVAFCLNNESVANMDRVEIGYDKVDVILEAYDGRKLNGFVYVNKSSFATSSDLKPSQRYVGVLIKGAKAANLKDSYIKKLEKIETYSPDNETLQRRRCLQQPDELPQVTVIELAKYKGSEKNFPTRLSILGYVLQPSRVYFQAHKGRDRTSRFLMQYNGLSLDDNEDEGRPPYPILTDLTDEEKEYVWRWLDHYLVATDGKAVGYLKEFRKQQLSGTTSWKLPQ